MLIIHLKALDSRYASQEELTAAGITLDQIPADWRMMAHQVKTIRALQNGDSAIIVNEARTGDGKTFAGQFPLFAYGWKTLTMYPTKELAEDQQRGLNDLLNRWNPPLWTKKSSYQVLNADKLDDMQEMLTQSRPEALKILLDNELTLTNPDIFHLMMQLGYSQYGAAKDLILSEVMRRYRMFVFDEFHQFGSAQAASVMIAMLLMREIARGKQTPRFLFLSATAQKFLENMAANISLRVEHIGGDYIHGSTLPSPGYRRILQPASLYLYPGRLEAWVIEHLDDVILRFYADHTPSAKGVIIANGVATAHRVHKILREPCSKAGIQLGLNTGMTPPSERDKKADLLVATSTIDVGVDFKINLLIFESIDAASHVQRLGRLGRHIKDDDDHEFTEFEAHALLPSWIMDELTKLMTDSELSRVDYEEKIRNVFHPFQEFEKYAEKWAGVQAAHVIKSLGAPEIRTQNEHISKNLSTQFSILFPKGVKQYRRLQKQEEFNVLEEAISFRGGSPFNALMLNIAQQSRIVVPYNLITLLTQCELENIEIEEFYKLTRRQGQTVKPLKRANPLAAFKLHSWLNEARTITINIDNELGEEYFEGVREINRVQIHASDGPDLHKLNRILEERLLVARLCHDKPNDLRRLLRLSYQLEIFNLTISGRECGSIAFARTALLIDSVLWPKKSSNDNAIFW